MLDINILILNHLCHSLGFKFIKKLKKGEPNSCKKVITKEELERFGIPDTF